MRRLLALALLSVVGCVPRETSMTVVDIPPPLGPDLAAEARLIASASAASSAAPSRGAGIAPRSSAAPVPQWTAAPASPSLLDPMDSCLPQAATAGKTAGSAPLDRKALGDELRWAKTRAEKCCPRYPGTVRVVVTLGPQGAPTNVGVALPGVASADLARCIRRLFDDVRVTPFAGAPVVETSSVSTENAPLPSTM